MTKYSASREIKYKVRAYTILELLIAMLVGLILTAMAIPQVKSSVNRYRLQGAVATVTWAVQSTRNQSLTEAFPFQLVLTKSTTKYQIQDLPPGAATYANVGNAVPLSGSPVSLNQDTTLQFLPNGSVTATVGTQSLTLTYKGLCQKVTVTNYGNTSLSSCP